MLKNQRLEGNTVDPDPGSTVFANSAIVVFVALRANFITFTYFSWPYKNHYQLEFEKCKTIHFKLIDSIFVQELISIVVRSEQLGH